MSDISLVRYNAEQKDKWNSFVHKAKNGLFMFDRDYMDYHSNRFTDHSLLFYEDEEIISVFPANEKGRNLYSHGGLTYGGLLTGYTVKQHTVNGCFDLLTDYARENGFEKVIYKPIPHIFHQQPAQEDLYALYRNGAKLTEVTASTVLNLKDPLKMPKGRKAQISRAKREGVEIKKLIEQRDFDLFISLENQVLESRHGVQAVHTADEIYLLYTRFPDQIHLYGAIKDEQMIAGTILFEYDQVVHTQYMASSELGREIGALDLAIATVINEYKDSKLWLDFGISTEDHGRILNEGLISQKEGFGGRTNIYSVWELDITGR